MSVIDREWLEARISKTKELIEAHEDALLALTVGGVQQYSLNTGQTQQTVTKTNIGSLRAAIGMLENRLKQLEGDLCGTGVVRVIPGF
jgi:hypothetical protein